METKQRQAALTLVLALVLVVLWYLPQTRWLMLPMVYFNTHLHEGMHAIVTLLTGGQVERIMVYADGSGVTPVRGGNILLIASAGYVGTALLGAGLVLAGQQQKSSRAALIGLAAAQLFLSLAFVRGDQVGVVTGFVFAALLLAAVRFLAPRQMSWLVLFLGIQLALTSFDAFRTLFQASLEGIPSDASIMQSYSRIPAVFWAGSWTLFSLILVGATFMKIFKGIGTTK